MNKVRLIAAVLLALVIGVLFVVNGGLDEPKADAETGQPMPNQVPDSNNNELPAQPGKKFNL